MFKIICEIVLISALVLTTGAFNNVFAAETDAVKVKKEEPSEIELMKLHFSYECEINPRCKEKVKDGRGSEGKEKFKFREYKTGKSAYDYVLKKKGKE